jgi:tetratricopeptide (TPR) repeat protein
MMYGRNYGILPAVLLLLLNTAPAHAAAVTVLLNSSPAHECYLEVERDRLNPDFEPCDSAIELQALGRKEVAATHANRGILYSREGRLRAALQDHNRAVKLAPELSATWINRANVYMRAQRFPEALSDLDVAIRIADDRLGVAHYNRALLFQRIGDIESARVDAEKALNLYPDSQEILGFARALNIVELPKEIAPKDSKTEEEQTR